MRKPVPTTPPDDSLGVEHIEAAIALFEQGYPLAAAIYARAAIEAAIMARLEPMFDRGQRKRFEDVTKWLARGCCLQPGDCGQIRRLYQLLSSVVHMKPRKGAEDVRSLIGSSDEMREAVATAPSRY